MMNNTQRMAWVLLMAAASACTPKVIVEQPDTQTSSSVPGVDWNYMDHSVLPAQDFYQFANGNWIKNNPVPESDSRYGSFNEVQDNNNKLLKEILEDAATKDYPEQDVRSLLGAFYKSYMDTVGRKSVAYASINEFFRQNAKCGERDALSLLLGYLHKADYSALFSMGVEQDLKVNTRYALYFGQPDMGLPNKDYYTKEDEHSAEIRTKYKIQIQECMQLTGLKVSGEEVLAYESELMSKAMSPVELRDYTAQYNKYTITDFEKMIPGINWDLYFKELGIQKPDTVIVSQPAYMKNMNEMLQNRDLRLVQYLNWTVLRNSVGYLSPELERLHFSFYSKELRGQKKMKEDWKRAIELINQSVLNEALGRAFVERAFPEDSKKKVESMISDLLIAFKDRLNKLEWMSEGTRQAALRKLGSFTTKIGYPEQWQDYSALKFEINDLLDMRIRCANFKLAIELQRLKSPIDKSLWEMPPHIVNAYYNPLLNEIVFPAGILQPPFFNPKAEDAVNYARMGAVIGHELTHGFDDQGAQFTADGLFQNWWQEQDMIQFQSRTQRLVNQYNRFQPVPGVFVNGKLTLGENIADFGGLTVAYYAFQRSQQGKTVQKVNGFTPEQRFFIAFAQIWKSNATEQYLRHQVQSDPHSPPKYRVNGTLSNMPEFFRAFNIKDGDAMRQPEEEISVIW